MNGYNNTMTLEQARKFRDDVLFIVSKIPRGKDIRCVIPPERTCCPVIAW